MRPGAFLNEGKFYKGNLHTHSTNSDGVLSPEPFSCEHAQTESCAAPFSCELAQTEFCAALIAHRLGHRDQCTIGSNWSPGVTENPTAVTERKGHCYRKIAPRSPLQL